MAFYASCFADFVSNISLIFFAAFIASFALRFGPPEFFTLILFSLTIIAGVAGDSLSKGVVSAALGLMMVMGVVGYIMLKFTVLAAPFLIAFILGPILEDSFRQSLVLSDGSYSIFARGPICWLFLTLAVASLAMILKRNLGKKKPEVQVSND